MSEAIDNMEVEEHAEARHIDLEAARRFVELLTGDADARIIAQTFADTEAAKDFDNKRAEAGRRRYFARTLPGTLSSLADQLDQLNAEGAGVYVTLNEMQGKRRTAEKARRARVFYLDLDGADLEPVLDFDPRPHLIVETSEGRYAAFWFVDGDTVSLDEWQRIQKGLAHRFGGDDAVIDLPRVARLPGSLHNKAGEYDDSWCVVRGAQRVTILRDNGDDPLVDADTMRGALGASVDAAAQKERAEPVAQTVGEGARHSEATRMAGKLRAFGFGRHAVEEALSAANAEQFDPPLPDSEIADIAAWAARQDVGGDDFRRDQKGRVIPNDQHNIRVALDGLGVTLSHDVFAMRSRVQRVGAQPQHLDDDMVVGMRLEIDDRFGFLPSKDLFCDVVTDYARRNSFPPVRDYLSSLSWDGVPRIDRWLIDYGGATDDEYTRAVGRILLIAAVRRVRRPGTKFDELVVLEGPQGTLKSSAIGALCPVDAWHSDDLPLNVDAKQVIERTSGKWLVEIAEMAGMRKAHVEAVKSFLSRQEGHGPA